MGSEPDVDAFEMEGMSADRERAERFAIFELQQADGTVSIRCRRLLRFGSGEDGQRESFDGGVVESVGGQKMVGVGIGGEREGREMGRRR